MSSSTDSLNEENLKTTLSGMIKNKAKQVTHHALIGKLNPTQIATEVTKQVQESFKNSSLVNHGHGQRLNTACDLLGETLNEHNILQSSRAKEFSTRLT